MRSFFINTSIAAGCLFVVILLFFAFDWFAGRALSVSSETGTVIGMDQSMQIHTSCTTTDDTTSCYSYQTYNCTTHAKADGEIYTESDYGMCAGQPYEDGGSVLITFVVWQDHFDLYQTTLTSFS